MPDYDDYLEDPLNRALIESMPLTVVTLATSQGMLPDQPAHVYGWRIPVDDVDEFREWMTVRYGKPFERLHTVGAIIQTSEDSHGITLTDGDL